MKIQSQILKIYRQNKDLIFAFVEISINKANKLICAYFDEITKQGKLIEFRFENDNDLCRDVFKSDTAKVIIPEIELELGTGTLGGVFIQMLKGYYHKFQLV